MRRTSSSLLIDALSKDAYCATMVCLSLSLCVCGRGGEGCARANPHQANSCSQFLHLARTLVTDACPHVVLPAGAEQTRCGMQILHYTHDTTVRDCVFENSMTGKRAEEVAQQVGIEVGPEPQRTILDGNVFKNMATDVRYISAAL